MKNTNQQLKQSQATQNKVQWSENKYLEMKRQLTGYWKMYGIQEKILLEIKITQIKY